MKQTAFLLFVLLLLAACYSPQQRIVLTTAEANPTDSLGGSLVRPYGAGYNFIVLADSLPIIEQRPMHCSEGVDTGSDSLWLRRNDIVVVAAAIVIPEDSTDSVWVKVARDQQTMGWLHERTLLDGVVPDDPVSQFIHYSSTRQAVLLLLAFVLAVALLLLFLRRRRDIRPQTVPFDVPSAYPTAFIVLLAALTQLYTLLQHSYPQQWVRFYYYPTLTPLSQPPLLAILLAGFWLFIILGIAVFSQILRRQQLLDAVINALTLLATCAAVYLFFIAVGPWQWVGWPCLLLFTAYSLHYYFRHARVNYLCGRCGAPLRQLGRCPYCDAINE